MSTRAVRKSKSALKAPRKLSRTKRPVEMDVAGWQRELRRQFGKEQQFEWRNVGTEEVFSEFAVRNPASANTYRVAIRGVTIGRNFCSCPDFGTNNLGTCKHIEFVLAKLQSRPKTQRALDAGYTPPFSEVFVEYGPQRRIRFNAGAECPRKLQQLAKKWFDDDGRLRDEMFASLEEFLAKATQADHELRCYPDAVRLLAQRRDDVHRDEILSKAFPRGSKSAAFKKLLKTDLFEYQREGALFAARAGRCLIGDEMGLGKTVQALAVAEILARHCGVERVLIVCPTSLKHQWEREIQRFTTRSAQVIGGSLTERKAAFAGESFFKVTNYDTLHRDLSVISDWSPDLVILDEAQRIKNWSTRAAKTVKRIESPHAIVLTGTPLENRLEELVSIVQFVDQHRMGPTWQLMHSHQQVDENGRVVGYRDLDQIGAMLQPILLRRRKAEVLSQLPKRTDQTLLLPMTQPQLDHHGENADLVARIAAKWRRMGFLSERDQQTLMIALQKMRMSCNSTFLLDKETDFSTKFEEFAERMESLLVDGDTKAVVFSQWLGTHELLQRRLLQRNWEHVLFHGGVESSKRKDLVQRFREDQNCRFFLSTDCGGVGLNLQHAHVVVNMDLPWNPAVLEQRIGRVYRMGQERPVQVFNFVSQGTIEDGMQSVLRFKKNLFAGVLDGGAKDIFMGESRFNQFMKTVESVTGQIPAAVPLDSSDNGEPVSGNGEAALAEPRDSSNGDSAARSDESPTQVASARLEVDPMADLLKIGLSFLEGLSQRNVASPPNRATNDSPLRIEADHETGRPYLRLALPDPETLDRVLTGVEALLQSLRARR